MLHKIWVFLFLLFAAAVQAALTVHIQSPWRDDAATKGYEMFLTGGATGYGYFDSNKMTAEDDGWYSFTWNKDVGAFSWEDFSMSLCPVNANNCTGGYNWKNASGEVKFKMTELFAEESELWIYTGSNSYNVSSTAPGSKVVWFKSPWGNRAVPQMIFGTDSIVMHPSTDKNFCGWFSASIAPAMMKANPVKSAYFTRYMTPYMSVPSGEKVIDLSAVLSAADTVFVDGTQADPEIDFSLGTPGECFDYTRTLHIYHPWRSNTTYRDSAVYITVGSNIANNPVAMTADEDFNYWWHYDFSEDIKSQDWNSCNEWGAKTNFYNKGNGGNKFWVKDSDRPCISEFFPKNVYEVWVYTKGNGKYEVLYSPLEKKIVRILSPWDNMSPMMIVDGDTVKMGPVSKDTCGWYQGYVFKHVDSWDVIFRQAFGYEYYTSNGLSDGDPIQLDSMMALHDMVWVYPYPLSSSGPRFSEKYPERLGICPTMKISAMVVDWAGEGFHDSIDVDFGNIYYGNEYTAVTYMDSTGKLAVNETCQSAWHPDGGYTVGMVQDTLVNGNPARADSSVYPWYECSAAREIEKWFIPVEVAKDASGKSYTNGVCRDIDLTLDEEGFWLADISESHEDGGFFPIDDLEFLDSAKTVRNPKFDWNNQLGTSSNGVFKQHNYSFAMKISAQFQYVKGQYFEFRGDDDVWVYINNRLVVDIGGCHNPAEKGVDLDTIGQNDPTGRLKLKEGETYNFHIFFSERNASGSNFKMRTSINLQTQKTYFPVAKKTSDGTIEYDLLQLLIDESLSCDVSSVSKIDTSYAQSVFMLAGGNLPSEGITLEPGLNYGGITISENMAGFIIDTSAIVRSRTLPSGNYALICYLAADLSQYQIVPFTVPEYPLPDIAFVNVFEASDSLVVFDPTGYNLRGQRLGEDGGKNDTMLAHVTYPEVTPLKIAVLYVGTLCNDCIIPLNFTTSDSLSFLDAKGQPVTSVTTDSTGFAYFYVVGETSITNASFDVVSNFAANTLHWDNLHFKEPPVPFVVHAQMHDMNGDGIPDSLAIPFSKPFKGVIPDTLSWSFGESAFHTITGMENMESLVFNDSMIIIKESKGLIKNVFTGASDEVYTGAIKYHYTYMDEETGDWVKLGMSASIEDHVGPVILSASIDPASEDISIITVNLSEGSVTKLIDGLSAFEIYRDSENISDSLICSFVDRSGKGNVLRLTFKRVDGGTLPALGDSIRLVPGVIEDLSGNKAHFENPKVRIAGKQRLYVEVPSMVHLGETQEPWLRKGHVAPIVVPLNRTAQEISDSLGRSGVLLKFNLGEIATEKIMNLSAGGNRDSALAQVRIDWENHYYTHLGNYVASRKGSIYCNDATVFSVPDNPERSNCFDNQGNIFFMWDGLSAENRMVGTGVYITKMRLKIRSGKETVGSKNDTYNFGIKRVR